MKFNEDIVEYTISGIPMIGNLKTGYTIGLTEKGKQLCHKAFSMDVSDTQFELLDKKLYDSVRTKLNISNEHSTNSKTVYFHVTSNCNLNCLSCYAGSSNKKQATDLPIEIVQRILASIAPLTKKLIISGGEPFLRDDLLEIVEFAYKQCSIHAIIILTNGALLHNIDLAKYTPYIKGISISLDSVSDEDNSDTHHLPFHTILDAIKIVKKAKIPISLNALITPFNYLDFNKFIELAIRNNVGIGFSLLSKSSCCKSDSIFCFTDKQLTKLGEIIASAQERYGSCISINDTPFPYSIATITNCGLGLHMLSIDAQGNCFPCHMLHNDENKLNTFNPDTKDIKDFFNVDEIEECSICDYRYVCGGGCRARALNTYGGAKRKDPYCALMKEYFRIRFSKLADTYSERR